VHRAGIFAVALAACTDATGPYVLAPGTEPQLPLEAARQECATQAEFRTLGGVKQIDWEQLERCMQGYGWVPEARVGPSGASTTR